MMKLLALAAPLFLLACSPPAADAPDSVGTIQMSADARASMDRINASRFVSAPQRADNPVGPTALASATSGANVTAKQDAAAPEVVAAEAPSDVTFDAGLVRIQVLLDRAHFSPGVVDGYDGDNVRKAVSAYQQANNMPVTGAPDDALLTRLEGADNAPALIAYEIAAADVAGPFVTVPNDLEAMSELDRVGYQTPEEGIAEKFHMDVDLLRLLNPGANFATAGTEIVVANAGGELSGQVASITVEKGSGAVRAFDANNNLLAYYPATIGSSDAPAPSGNLEVRAVAFDPTYHYDPERLPTFGQRDHGALTIAAGPNNPVGAVWIALSEDTYGIHGAPEPAQVSKTASHGCVRLTNWDAVELGRAVRQGVPVTFTDA